ncbi:1-aminocyclopropane-1-carboxylate deaminase [Thioclava sp. SK-1]|uniref:pyridoxal phosphate-dependent aminotransferase n=1 Tax=Thioclava sp. SK-1 TaxID=1889770 RepID=UPI0008248475|nr:aminotransferase class I/II-fold pyridoxal phosphate-dependent enzyme [Thioclava sp. SK-1]OCX66079.1 1-aminocyclopropane-1-carboxylate deaminase [Thioclava sp. SK-1]
MRVSKRGQVAPFIAMDVMNAASEAEAAGRDIVHMEVGQPATSAPAGARQALAQALDTDAMGYTMALGLPALRQGIADLYARWYGLTLDPARVVVTSGSSGAFLLAFTALFDAGDKVGLGEPGYPSYRQVLRALSLEPVGIVTHAQDRYHPTPAHLTEDLSGVILASPGNPSGTMLDRDALGALLGAAKSRGISVVSDEIYHGLHYDQRAVSALELSDDVYVVNSFSKYFSMTGWRVGWMIVPPDHIRTVERLAQHMFICAPHAAQVAALGALSSIDELEANLAVYAGNRQVMLDGLAAAGFVDIAPPDGAFYIYVDVAKFTDDSVTFAQDILEQAGVAVTPGCDFDPARGHQTLRLSYAQSRPRIQEGMKRLQRFMQSYR